MPMVEAFVWTGGVFERVPDHTNRSTPKYKIPCLEQQSPPTRFDTASTRTLLACNRWCMFMMESNQRGDLSRERETAAPLWTKPLTITKARFISHLSPLCFGTCAARKDRLQASGRRCCDDLRYEASKCSSTSATQHKRSKSNLWSGRKGGSRLCQRGAAYIRTHLRSSQVPPDLVVARTPIVSCRCLLA